MQIVSDDSDLINKFLKGEEAAIKIIYDFYYRPLCFFAEQLTNNRTEAEDIAVETFLKLLKKRYDFDKLSDIKAFLFTAARNACIDFLRKTKRLDKSNRELAYLSQSEELFGEREMLTAKVLQLIYAEVENLPGQCKEVFKSIFIECKSTAAIASEMGISTQTVLNHKTRALQILRLTLYKEGFYYAVYFLIIFF